MRSSLILLLAMPACAFSLGVANAQSPPGAMKGMSGGSMAGMSKGDMAGMGGQKMMAMDADMAAMRKMHAAMMSAKGSNADVTFVRKMLAHHQGAIDMAQIEIKYGSDAGAKRIAEQTIQEQTKSKGELEAWLKAHGG